MGKKPLTLLEREEDKKPRNNSNEAVEYRLQQAQLRKKLAYRKYSALRRQWAAGRY